MTVAERREREREARRDHILDAAERVFWDRGFAAAKMRDIAEAAQLGKGTLYLYFRTKEDLALGLAVRHQQDMVERFEQARRNASDGLSLLRELLTAYAERMTTPREHLKLALGRWASGEPFDLESQGAQEARRNVQRVIGIVCDAIAWAQSEGTLRDDTPPQKLAVFMWSSVNGALLLRLKLACFRDESVPIVEHVSSIEEHVELLLGSLRPVPITGDQLHGAGNRRAC